MRKKLIGFPGTPKLTGGDKPTSLLNTWADTRGLRLARRRPVRCGKAELEDMDLPKWIDWIKLPPRLIAALALTIGVLLFSPQAFVDRLGLADIVEGFRGWIGLGFLVFSALLFSHLAAWLRKACWPWIGEAILIRRGKKRLACLDDAERKLLAQFLEANSRSLSLPVDNGTVNVLVKERILFQVSRLGDFVEGFAFAIQPWAWEYLQEKRELLAPHLTIRSTSARANTRAS